MTLLGLYSSGDMIMEIWKFGKIMATYFVVLNNLNLWEHKDSEQKKPQNKGELRI